MVCILLLPFEHGRAEVNIICLCVLLYCQTIELASVWLLACYDLVLAFFEFFLLLSERFVLLPQLLVSRHVFLDLLEVNRTLFLFKFL